MVHDVQGSPAAILNQDGTLEARFAFNAWGELVNPLKGYGTDPDAAAKQALTTIGYTGHETLWKAGLVHTYARLYNPHLGRWLSPDSTIPGMYTPQSLNRYSYVLNDPLNFIDPRGYSSCGGLSGASPSKNWGAQLILLANGGGGSGCDLPPITVIGHCDAICHAIKARRAFTQRTLRRLERVAGAHGDFSGSNEPGQGLLGPRRAKKEDPCGTGRATGRFGAPAPSNSPRAADTSSKRLYNPNLQSMLESGVKSSIMMLAVILFIHGTSITH